MRPLLLLLLFGCAACTIGAARPKAPADAKPAAATGDTLARIRAMIGPATCSASSQCRTLPVGAKSCGGPQFYLPYSTANTDVAALTALADQYKAERQAADRASGAMSDCRMVTDPGAVCRAGTCQLNAPSGAPSAI